MAHSIQSKLDTINQRYSDLSKRNDKYSDTVTTTQETVTTVETLVDDFDDFVIPAVERLSSPEFMQQDTNTISRELEVRMPTLLLCWGGGLGRSMGQGGGGGGRTHLNSCNKTPGPLAGSWR